ncbi:ankyrin repeat domain-containing protein 10 isoform X3 [Lingula anatina]|uniref:Ankyrin repeat domain-containing protein 10 isoform X3 n=1 Tax=Lingula anatina TaxID=7574 RepID=A0A1S3HPD0_LINAN|nr:ankyrin repeat domain-containing protein 10 isoform X3 [Lingula anatina]|eukprot:XP_013387891.1 ankyrin repeat domain-containing protein 10 isoform X3 [Lingula anatina]
MDETSGFGYWGGMSEEILKRDYPLHRACRDGDVEALSLLLLQAQHSVYVEDTFYGWTPAHWAAYFGRLACLRKLMSITRLGADCDVLTTRFLQTPAHIAAFGGHPGCLQWLLQSGAGRDKQDYLGETPIHKAARTGSMECISLLASHGASLTIRSYSGNIPAQLARNCGYEECANYLERALEQQKLQQTGQTPGLLPPVTANEESSEKNHDCVVKQGLNGGLLPPPDTVTTNGINEQDHEMEEMDSDSHDLHQGQGDGPQGHHLSNPPVVNGHINAHPHLHPTVNGSSQVHLNGDILLQNGVSSNLVPIAGHKRCREDDGEENYKKVRRGDVFPCVQFSSPMGDIFNSEVGGATFSWNSDHNTNGTTFCQGSVVSSRDGKLQPFPSDNDDHDRSARNQKNGVATIDEVQDVRRKDCPHKCMALAGHYI